MFPAMQALEVEQDRDTNVEDRDLRVRKCGITSAIVFAIVVVLGVFGVICKLIEEWMHPEDECMQHAGRFHCPISLHPGACFNSTDASAEWECWAPGEEKTHGECMKQDLSRCTYENFGKTPSVADCAELSFFNMQCQPAFAHTVKWWGACYQSGQEKDWHCISSNDKDRYSKGDCSTTRISDEVGKLDVFDGVCKLSANLPIGAPPEGLLAVTVF